MLTLNLHHHPLQRPAHASLTGTRCNNTAPQISVKLEIIPCGADFQRPCLTSLKVQLRGWGIFSAVPCCLAPVCILPREIPELMLGVEQQRLSPGSWAIHDGEVEVVTYWWHSAVSAGHLFWWPGFWGRLIQTGAELFMGCKKKALFCRSQLGVFVLAIWMWKGGGFVVSGFDWGR